MAFALGLLQGRDYSSACFSASDFATPIPFLNSPDQMSFLTAIASQPLSVGFSSDRGQSVSGFHLPST